MYRVDIKLNETGDFVEYAGRKNPLSFEMAKSLSIYLKRQKSSGRLVKVPEERVIDQW